MPPLDPVRWLTSTRPPLPGESASDYANRLEGVATELERWLNETEYTMPPSGHAKAYLMFRELRADRLVAKAQLGFVRRVQELLRLPG